MAQSQRGYLHNHSHGNNIADGPSWSNRPIVDDTANPASRQSSVERRPHAHRHASNERPHRSRIHGPGRSPLFVPGEMYRPNQESMTDHHPVPQYSNGFNAAQRTQLALPRFSSHQTSEAASAHTHYPGDGLDFRRPIMSNGEARTRQSQVVDLTVDEDLRAGLHEHRAVDTSANGSVRTRRQGLPRFDRDIIDVEDEPAPHMGAFIGHDDLEWQGSFPSSRQPTPPDDGDDVVITNARPLNPTARLPWVQSRRSTPALRSISPQLANFDDLIDLTDDNDDVIITETRQRDNAEHYGVNAQQPAVTGGFGTRAMSAQAARIADLIREQPRLMHRMEAMGLGLGQMMPLLAQDTRHHVRRHQFSPGGHAHHHGGAARAHPRRPINLPTMMDYENPAFDLGIMGGGGLPPPPRYSPPPIAPHGFTSSPTEDEVVVCPNCGDELAVGGKRTGDPDDEVKQQAYCGTCATRKAAAGQKGKGKGKEKATNDSMPQPLKRCVVDGCGQPASKSSLIHVYLSQCSHTNESPAGSNKRFYTLKENNLLESHLKFLSYMVLCNLHYRGWAPAIQTRQDGYCRVSVHLEYIDVTSTLFSAVHRMTGCTSYSFYPTDMNRPADSQQPAASKQKIEPTTETAPPSARSLYLIAYNAVSTLLWAVILGRVLMITLLYGGGARSGFGTQASIDWLGGPNVYRGVGEFAKWTQTLAGLEVLHALIGLVRAPLITTVMQVASRFLLVWGIVHFFPATALSPLYSTMLLAWSITEVIRYSYFAVNLAYGKVPSALVWARYNAFFVLYPLGISSECWLVWLATGPAKYFFHGLDWVLYGILIIYVPGKQPCSASA
nr:putative very-long-chain (3r)-3-hydroxyacyl-coa dehydratase [Quercus suber]